jgi:hypothetical protein
MTRNFMLCSRKTRQLLQHREPPVRPWRLPFSTRRYALAKPLGEKGEVLIPAGAGYANGYRNALASLCFCGLIIPSLVRKS